LRPFRCFFAAVFAVFGLHARRLHAAQKTAVLTFGPRLAPGSSPQLTPDPEAALTAISH
jgi:hypothetical protein